MAKSASKSFKLKRAYELAFSPDAKVVATIGRDVIFWSTATRKRLLSVHPLSHPSHIDFSPDGASLAIKSTSGRIVILDAAKGRIVTDCANQTEGEGAPVYFTRDGHSVVDASWDGTLSIRSASDEEVTHRESVGGMVSNLSANADRRFFAYTIGRRAPSPKVSPPHDLIVFRRWPFARSESAILPVARPFIRAIALSPSATRLAVFYGAPPDPLEVIDVSTGRVLASAQIGSGGSGHSLAWSPDESMLGCVVDGGISLFDSSSLRRTHMIPLSYPAFVTFSADQRFLGLGSWNDSRVLDMSELAPFEVHANAA
jgi:WD40 repeat protein